MSRALSVMRTNVGNDIQDTSSDMGDLIDRYLNRRYMDVIRRVNWNYINEDYTISVTSGTQDYALPSDFKNELYAYDQTNKIKLARIELQDWVRTHENGVNDSGSVEAYAVFKSDDGSKYARFFYNPNSNITVDFPYLVNPTALSADGDTPALDIEDLMEIGATADAWRYKRQFVKAREYETLYEQKLTDYIWEQESQPNLTHTFSPRVTDRDSLY
jgi:hypothetical protein